MAAAQKLSNALGIGLDEVLAAVRGADEPAAASAAERSATAYPSAATGHGSAPTATVVSRDYAAAVEGLAVIRPADVDEVTRQVSRDGLVRLNVNQRIVVAAVLIGAVFSMLPHEVRERLLDDINLVTVIANVLELIKR